jgi:hypothetical protein
MGNDLWRKIYVAADQVAAVQCGSVWFGLAICVNNFGLCSVYDVYASGVFSPPTDTEI